MRMLTFIALLLAACSTTGPDPFPRPVNPIEVDAFFEEDFGFDPGSLCGTHNTAQSCSSDPNCVISSCCPGVDWQCVENFAETCSAFPDAGMQCPNGGICPTFDDQVACESHPGCYSLLDGNGLFVRCANGPAPCITNGVACTASQVQCPSNTSSVYDEASGCIIGCAKPFTCGV